MTRALTLAVAALLGLAACGKVGPPVRATEPAPSAVPAAAPPVSAPAAPDSGSAEQCDDPNAAATEAKP